MFPHKYCSCPALPSPSNVVAQLSDIYSAAFHRDGCSGRRCEAAERNKASITNEKGPYIPGKGCFLTSFAVFSWDDPANLSRQHACRTHYRSMQDGRHSSIRLPAGPGREIFGAGLGSVASRQSRPRWGWAFGDGGRSRRSSPVGAALRRTHAPRARQSGRPGARRTATRLTC